MNNNIEVSVAVITYNMAKYLPTLLDSILCQKVSFKYEIIIDDDNSPDNTREILFEYQKKYPEIIKLSLRNENIGGSKNMYGVLQQCRGKYIAILEGDDWWDNPNKLQYQYDFMEKHNEFIGMYMNSWVEESLTEIKHHPRRNITEPMVFTIKDFYKDFFFDRLPNSTDTAFFRNIFKMYPEDDFSVFYKAHRMVWDQSLALILYSKGNIYVDPKIVSHHRSIVMENGTNYQSLYAKENHCETDAYMYYQHELFLERVTGKHCWKFYKVRADVYAESRARYKRSKSNEDKKQMRIIWKQRKNKTYLFYGLYLHYKKSLKN